MSNRLGKLDLGGTMGFLCNFILLFLFFRWVTKKEKKEKMVINVTEQPTRPKLSIIKGEKND